MSEKISQIENGWDRSNARGGEMGQIQAEGINSIQGGSHVSGKLSSLAQLEWSAL